MKDRKIFFFPKIMEKLNIFKYSFKFQLILSFVLVSIIPLLLIQTISTYVISESMRENIDEIIALNLVQTRKSLDLTLSGYDDFIYQIYTNDEIINNINNINNGHDIAMNVNQLRRHLRSFSSAKPSVQCLTLITSSGKLIAYDKLTAITFESSWLNEEEEAQKLYQNIATSNDTVIIETGNATQFGVNPYYLFHMAHRMIDYKNIFSDVGIIIISLDESVLAEACNEKPANNSRSNYNFVVDNTGKLISFADRTQIGKTIDIDDEEAIEQLVQDSGIINGNEIAIHKLRDEKTNWTIINATDQSDLFAKVHNQQRITIIVGLFAAFMMVLIILPITRRLSGSITKVVKAMSTAGTGELTVRIDNERIMPIEIQKIADQFNSMIQEISLLVDEVKKRRSGRKKRKYGRLNIRLTHIFCTIRWIQLTGWLWIRMNTK